MKWWLLKLWWLLQELVVSETDRVEFFAASAAFGQLALCSAAATGGTEAEECSGEGDRDIDAGGNVFETEVLVGEIMRQETSASVELCEWGCSSNEDDDLEPAGGGDVGWC